MMFLHSLIPTRFSEVLHGVVIRVLHKLVKRSTIPQVELKQNTLLDLCGIINALGVLEDNGLKNNHPIIVTLPSTDLVYF